MPLAGDNNDHISGLNDWGYEIRKAIQKDGLIGIELRIATTASHDTPMTIYKKAIGKNTMITTKP